MSARCLDCHVLTTRGTWCVRCAPRHARGRDWSMRIVPAIRARDGHRCTQCGSTAGPFDVDHIKPRAIGGTDDFTNLRLICRSLNRGGKCKP